MHARAKSEVVQRFLRRLAQIEGHRRRLTCCGLVFNPTTRSWGAWTETVLRETCCHASRPHGRARNTGSIPISRAIVRCTGSIRGSGLGNSACCRFPGNAARLFGVSAPSDRTFRRAAWKAKPKNAVARRPAKKSCHPVLAGNRAFSGFHLRCARRIDRVQYFWRSVCNFRPPMPVPRSCQGLQADRVHRESAVRDLPVPTKPPRLALPGFSPRMPP